MSVSAEYILDHESEQSCLGYTTPDNIDLFARAHPEYRQSNRVYKRMWDALARHQSMYRASTEVDGQVVSEGFTGNLFNGGNDRELFRLTPNPLLSHHFELVAAYPDAANGLYFDTALYLGGVEINLDTASALVFDPQAHISGIGPRGRQFMQDYIRFKDGEPIEYGRNNYQQPNKIKLLGQKFLSLVRWEGNGG